MSLFSDAYEVLKIMKEIGETKEQSRFSIKNAAIFILVVGGFCGLAVIATEGVLFSIPVLSYLVSAVSRLGLSDALAKTFMLAIIEAAIIGTVYIFLRFCGWLRGFVGYTWSPHQGLSDWDFQGNITIDVGERALHIIQSDLGCVVRGRRWRNFDFTFDFKVPGKLTGSEEDKHDQFNRGFGVIYRAAKLGEYYMLKIDTLGGYQPHTRNVLWENNRCMAVATLSAKDLDQWVSAQIKVRGSMLTAKIGKDPFSFGIPSHSNIQRSGEDTSRDHKDFENKPYAEIPFHKDGTVGFRSAFYEEVYIRNIRVKPVLGCPGFARRLVALLGCEISVEETVEKGGEK